MDFLVNNIAWWLIYAKKITKCIYYSFTYSIEW